HAFSFPSPVNDPNPLVRYVTFEPPATITVTADSTTTAAYITQDFLTVQAAPPEAAAADAGLTPSGWQTANTIVNLNTDPLITISADTRFRFDHWSGDVSDTYPATAVLMNGPKTVTANYVSQHLLTVNTTGLG